MSTPAKPLTSSRSGVTPRRLASRGALSGAAVLAPAPPPPVSVPMTARSSVSGVVARAVDAERAWAAEWPTDRTAEWTAALVAAVVLATLSPLGLASGEAADQVAQALGVRRPYPAATPLADLLVRWSTLLPAGEVGTRPHAVGILAGAAALALLLAQVRLQSRARLTMATLVGLALLALSRPFLQVASIQPALAVDFCLLAAIAVTAQSICHDPRLSTAGLALAFLCGLAAGGGWAVRVATWPPGIVLTVWALRRGERWPLLAPTMFVAGAAVILAAPVSAPWEGSAPIRMLIQQLVAPATARGAHRPNDVRQIFAWIVDDVGILGLLVGIIGCAVSLPRAGRRSVTGFVVWGAAVAASFHAGDLLAARLFVVAGLVAPVVMAADFFSQSFGRARPAVALVLVVIVVVPPALVGVGAALALPGRRDATAVARGLDLAFAAQGSPPVLGGDWDDAQRWWRYAAAVGALSQAAPGGGPLDARSGAQQIDGTTPPVFDTVRRRPRTP